MPRRILSQLALMSALAIAASQPIRAQDPPKENKDKNETTPPSSDSGATRVPADSKKKKGLFDKLNDKLNKGKETVEKASAKANEVNQQLGGVPLMVLNPAGAAIATAQAASANTSTKTEEPSAQKSSATTGEQAGSVNAAPKKKGVFGKLNDKLNKVNQKLQEASETLNPKPANDKPAEGTQNPKPDKP